jgi:two-component system OmpR family response regulator
MSNGILTLNLVTRQVKVGGCDHALSHREFALLRALLARPGALLSRAALEDRIYGPSTEIESNVVEYIIHGLRQKLGPTVIKNVRGLGWMVERST